MRAVGAPAQRALGVSYALIAGGLASIALLMVARTGGLGAVSATGLFVAAIAVRRPHVRWELVLGVLVLVILFIPIRRYKLPVEIGFQLEIYRVVVALILAGWFASLLVDPRVVLRRTGFDRRILIVVLAVIASVLANPARVSDLASSVLKSVTFLLSFIVVLYLMTSVVRKRSIADAVVKFLVAGGAVLAALTILESRTGATPFSQMGAYLPFLVTDPTFETELGRLGARRAFGSAEHPIALSAALVLLIPLAIYVVRTSGPLWYVALLVLVVGVVSTVSRTGIVMLICLGIAFLCLRPRETRRLWPLVVPLLVATHLAVPGTLGALKESFVPAEGLLAQQRSSEGSCSSAGRIADLGPTLAEVAKRPLLGQGYGTRIVTGEGANACILDNQWLAHLLEVGIFGFFAWLLLFVTVIRRLGSAAKRDDTAESWLLVAVTASAVAYAVGMLTFDALGFVQVTILLFIILGIGAAAAALQDERASEQEGRQVGSAVPGRVHFL